MVDIQYATAEIGEVKRRREKEERIKKKPQGKHIMARPM